MAVRPARVSAKVILPVFFLVLISASWLLYSGISAEARVVDVVWNGIEQQYDRRLQLTFSLVESLNKNRIESTLLAGLSNARERVVAAPSRRERMLAYNELDIAVAQLVHGMPTIRDERILELVAELESSSRRVSMSRNDFNESVLQYTEVIQKVPHRFVAPLVGFRDKEFFTPPDDPTVLPLISLTAHES